VCAELKSDLDGLDSMAVLKGSAELQAGEGGGDVGLYDDEETRQFYENLPDLKAVIPQVHTSYRYTLQVCTSYR